MGDNPLSTRYAESLALLARAERSIPLGSQTFSKSRTAFPVGASPLYLERAKGSRVWDVDGNEYVDFVSALLAVSLGYGDSDVDAAVARQMRQGVTLSLPLRLECELAERIVALVPCAEMVRFGKNGSDATSGAIRVARAYTGRDRVAVCGYHGWQDWYIGSTTRDKGVPARVKELTHTFAYNRLDTLDRVLEQHPGEFAAIILEPMSFDWPAPGFLGGVRERATRTGAVLVFDETITGFRFAPGGAQQLFGVTPDLATFGKGLANGYPLSLVAGSRALMREMEEIFFSFTFGGEALSLAAGLAVLDKMAREPVLERVHATGQRVLDGVNRILEAHALGGMFSIAGHPAWTLLKLDLGPGVDPMPVKTLLLQEILRRGVLTGGSHNITYAHSDRDVARLLTVYDEVLPAVQRAVAAGSVAERLECAPLQALFKVR